MKPADFAAPVTVASSEEPPAIVRAVKPRIVAQLTGSESRNDTASRWDVHGTDLGHMFWHRDRLYMVFGDTFGPGGFGGSNWRSNTMARIADPNPHSGLPFETMITGADGAAKELIPSLKISGLEQTVIPTYGISIDGRMYLHYMSVRQWGESGQWEVKHSGFAYSDDDGETWSAPAEAVWPSGGGFDQVALVRGAEFVYTFGIPEGRFGGVRLRRSPSSCLHVRDAYQYWDGEGWVRDPEAAAMVVPAPVGELSVAWSSHHRQWLMTYLNMRRRAIVLRTAPALTGPWGEEQIILTAADYPRLYGPYIVPSSDLLEDLFFTLSLYGPYNVFLVHAKLVQGAATVAENDL